MGETENGTEPVEDLVTYFSKHDDSDFPYYGKRGNFEYKNEAYRKQGSNSNI